MPITPSLETRLLQTLRVWLLLMGKGLGKGQAKGLCSLGNLLDWDAAWECLGIGTLAEGGCRPTPKPTQSSGGMNNRHTRVCKLLSL